MKIIYLIAGTYRAAGMEKVLAGKANWLARHGWDVSIVTTDQRGREPAFPLDPSIRCHDLGIDYEENNGASFLNKVLHYPGKQRRHRKALTELLMKERPDITVSMFCNDASFLPRIKDGSRKLLEIHFSRFKRIQYGRKGLFGLADRILSRRDRRAAGAFDRFVVLTREDRNYWGDIPGIRVIPNARPFRSGTPAPLDTRRVLAVGRFSFQKGFDRLIDAWNLIPRELKDAGWTLDLIGDGELRDSLQVQIDALGLQGSIRLGHVEKNMQEAYREASILALSSRYEGLPMVLIEAQSAGVPAVAFACKCGPRDIITDGADGLLVPEGDIPALATALERLMRDEKLRRQMGAAAFRASERYEEETIMAQWCSLFQEMLDE